jgi:hypothetical protein
MGATVSFHCPGFSHLCAAASILPASERHSNGTRPLFESRR